MACVNRESASHRDFAQRSGAVQRPRLFKHCPVGPEALPLRVFDETVLLPVAAPTPFIVKGLPVLILRRAIENHELLPGFAHGSKHMQKRDAVSRKRSDFDALSRLLSRPLPYLSIRC